MNSLIASIEGKQNEKFTENGAKTYASTMNHLYDFYALGGAMRNRKEGDLIFIFSKAFQDDSLYAMKCLFYFRDIRGGQGERRIFRVIMEYLANSQTEIIRKLLPLFPEYGRWDDLFIFFGTYLEKDMLSFVKNQFSIDMKSDKPSLLGKWLSSPNTSSSVSRMYAKQFANAFGMKIADYRKALSSLRKKIDIVERNMSAKTFNEINYSHVPSRASMIYRKSFYKQDGDRYQKFIESLKKGEVKINASTLYPYDLVNKYVDTYITENDETINELWNALPNYIEDDESNSIAVCDVSGSMMNGKGLPYAVSVSLGIYFAERSKGPFANYFLTFSRISKLIKVRGNNLYEKIVNFRRDAEVGYDTNLQSVFNTILDHAVKNKCSQKELPARVFIITDMEFNDPSVNGNRTNFEVIKEKYERAGYNLPKIIFWNVDAKQDNCPINQDEKGVYLVSGCSAATFKYILNTNAVSGVQLMLSTLDNPRYEKVSF